LKIRKLGRALAASPILVCGPKSHDGGVGGNKLIGTHKGKLPRLAEVLDLFRI
jgi:hypothetical protein